MIKRKIITIDEAKCTGCGLCIPDCPEGALQVIDGKARLVSDLLCDGLGACLGACPEGAMTIEEREAEQYDERKVMENIIKQGEKVLQAHLEHLRDHGETGYLNEALGFLKEKNLPLPAGFEERPLRHPPQRPFAGCPGSRVLDLREAKGESVVAGAQPSCLRQWPVQLHLVPPLAPYFQKADILLTADCVAYALGDFHANYLQGKSLAIACPKLDMRPEVYVEKIRAWVDEARANSLTIMIMEVPCCRGLLEIAKRALNNASRKIPVKYIVVGVKGNIVAEENWVTV